jgi:hypothetical protein
MRPEAPLAIVIHAVVYAADLATAKNIVATVRVPK